ncbi:lytic transglycosylase domain-containing protein [Mucilaginibacter glaciei]|uniref:Lytic transglycosylase domain-containing protein n=1 Tax=Mucilaginibacter glaciei TaxID=2772109 RepID=A0A926NT07_9SPHI|nr:lytic transglycosylase domain-containing protein [Mucilaginibacter glaciei]MBD1394175.1 lytic transglycosylase domain-containing protein [Mucilaginibacter glaciei]
MSKFEMTKKHLITCSVIFVLVIISRLNIFSTNPVFTVKTAAITHADILFAKPVEEAEMDYNFANEALPVNDQRVNFKLKKSLAKHKFKNIQSNILHAKADKLFPVIEPILKFYGIPQDFKFIPLVESGLNGGTSPKGAKGIWQFMPGTARSYGLRVGKGIDDRLNTRKSTIAACKYIKELYAEFNSWTLAAAAYNNGSIKLERAINKQNEDNYFRMTLNRETGSYLYKIIAMKEVINHPGKYGYKNFYSYQQKMPELPLVAFNN